MPPAPRRAPRGAAHYLAPAAFLAGVTIAVLLVHSALRHHASTTASVSTQTQTQTVAHTRTTRTTKHPAKRFYTVQSGDTFGSIAGKVGISVARLQALNPGVSSNALHVGQRLRIR
jgi:LysM repeat protein